MKHHCCIIFLVFLIWSMIGCGTDNPTAGENQPGTTTDPAVLVINEIDTQGEPSGFVEIYNTSGDNFEPGEGQLYLTHILTETNEYAIPNQTINAYGYLVLWCDGGGTNLHADFLLDNEGSITLTWSNNGGMQTLETTNWTTHKHSLGRYPDGSSQWLSLKSTPGSSNQTNSTAVLLSMTLKINEVYSKTTDTDFVELYNTSADTFSIEAGRWLIKDNQDINAYTLPATNLTGYGFLVVGFNWDSGNGVTTPFSLGAEDSARLYFIDTQGVTNLVDSYSWTNHMDLQSKGRYPDGSDTWNTNLTPSPGTVNTNTNS